MPCFAAAYKESPNETVVLYILNKSENATPELFAIYKQNDARR